MYLIMDLVLNHSSDKHKWFEKSVKKIYPYTDYYVWRNPSEYTTLGHPIEPNNWKSLFGGSAWTWNEERRQFYYHVFLPQQPDLNLRNKKVKDEIIKIIKFWMREGVAGMRMDAVNWLMEDQSFEDEEPYDKSKNAKHAHFYELKHDKTVNIPATYDYIYELRKELDKISQDENTIERIMLPEAWGSTDELKLFYGNKTHRGVHFPFNFLIMNHWDYLNPNSLNWMIDSWLNITPNFTVPNWQLDCHDKFRSSFKFVQEYVNILIALMSVLPGVTVLYYGDEIGMTNGVVRPHERKLWSEYSRSPMQWDSSINGGFTTNKKAWLSVNPNHYKLNVKTQKADSSSTLSFVRSLLHLKKTNTIKYGNLDKYILSDWIYVIKRSYNSETYILILNLGTELQNVRLKPKIKHLTSELVVYLTSPNSNLKKGAVIKNKSYSFVMWPMSVVVLRGKINT